MVSCCSGNDAGSRAKLEKRLYSLIHVNVVRKAGPIFQPAGACHKTLWEIDWKYNRSTIVNRAELENYFVQNRFPSIARESGSFPKCALGEIDGSTKCGPGNAGQVRRRRIQFLHCRLARGMKANRQRLITPRKAHFQLPRRSRYQSGAVVNTIQIH